MKIIEISDNIYNKDGIWFSNKNTDISYPSEGNKDCFEIEKDSFWFKHRNNCIIEAVKKYSISETFFDIGGGNGYVAKGLEENKIKTILIEPGLQGVLNAKKNGLKNIISSTLEDLNLKPNTCKAIGLFDVVEHIENDINFLKSIHKNLAENGYVYITVPAYKILWSKEDKDAGHYRRYTINEISTKLKNIGFEIEYKSYIFSILPLPIFIFRTIPSLLGFNKKSSELKKHKQEHSPKKGVFSYLLDKIWCKELSYIQQKKRIPFGGSCFIIGKKITSRNK